MSQLRVLTDDALQRRCMPTVSNPERSIGRARGGFVASHDRLYEPEKPSLASCRARTERQNLAGRAQRQLGPVGHCQFSEYTIKIFLYRTLNKAQFVGDLFVGFRLADQRHDLLLAEREFGVPGGLRYDGSPASRTTILPSEGAKAITATGATSRWRRWRDCNVVFRHELVVVGSGSVHHRNSAQ